MGQSMGASNSTCQDCCLRDSKSRVRKESTPRRRGIPANPPAGFLCFEPYVGSCENDLQISVSNPTGQDWFMRDPGLHSSQVNSITRRRGDHPAGISYMNSKTTEDWMHLKDRLNSSPPSTRQDSKIQDQIEIPSWELGIISNPTAFSSSYWNGQEIVYPSAFGMSELKNTQIKLKNSVTFDDNVTWMPLADFEIHESQPNIDQSIRSAPNHLGHQAAVAVHSPKRPLTGCLRQSS